MCVWPDAAWGQDWLCRGSALPLITSCLLLALSWNSREITTEQKAPAEFRLKEFLKDTF